MSAIKALFEKLQEAIPQECPCGRDLTTLADWERLNELIQLITEMVEEQHLKTFSGSGVIGSLSRKEIYNEGGEDGATIAEKEGWFWTGYKIGKEVK